MSNAKKLSPKEKVWKEFLDDIDNPELQNRFDGFVADEKRYVDQYNEMVETINEQLADKSALEGIIINSAMLGISPAPAVEKLKVVNGSVSELQDKMSELGKKIAEKQKLIKQYKHSSDGNLFIYWKVLREVDDTVKEWAVFKEQYKDRIF